jgi:sugar-specific transcriptional regulator TrmB
MNNLNDAISKLASFGLGEFESRIYLYILGKEPMTVVQIALGTTLARTTIYDNIQKLITKGLVEKIIKYKSQQFKAYPLEILDSVIDQEKTKVEKLTESLNFLKTNISNLLSQNSSVTQVRYFHDASGIRQMMWNALSANKENVGYSLLGRKEIVGEKFLQRFLEEFNKRKLVDRVLINPQKESLKYISDGNLSINGKLSSSEKIRIIPESDLKITGDTTIYNNIFAVMYWKNGEIVGVEIENPELVTMQKSMFEILWKTAIPL